MYVGFVFPFALCVLEEGELWKQRHSETATLFRHFSMIMEMLRICADKRKTSGNNLLKRIQEAFCDIWLVWSNYRIKTRYGNTHQSYRCLNIICTLLLWHTNCPVLHVSLLQPPRFRSQSLLKITPNSPKHPRYALQLRRVSDMYFSPPYISPLSLETTQHALLSLCVTMVIKLTRLGLDLPFSCLTFSTVEIYILDLCSIAT